MSLTKFKRFIACFSIAIILLSFLIPNFDNVIYLAATVATTETTKKKTVGHKIEGAEYYEELWDKFSVIAIDNGGGSGEGGGAGDSNASNAGNSGTYQDAGGTFGKAAGQGLGTGNVANQAGTGSSSSGGTTGSVKADALRALKAQIEESRAESIRKVLETAKNVESVEASIAERESIQSSIQKRIQQESIKAKIAQAETQKQYETPVYIEETSRRNQVLETFAETVSPTSVKVTSRIFDEKVNPTSRFIEQIVAEELDLKPTPVYAEIDILREESIRQTTISNFEPGDYIPETNAKNLITYNVNQTVVNSPTSANANETMSDVTETTLQVFDSPIVEAETTVNENETAKENEETKSDENKDVGDEEDGRGSKGGDDAEKEEDLKGDDGENESEGNADEKGQYQKETEGEFAGKKIFELDRNGDFGIKPEHLSVTNMRGLVSAVMTLLFLLGALTFVIGTKDKKKNNNYF